MYKGKTLQTFCPISSEAMNCSTEVMAIMSVFNVVKEIFKKLISYFFICRLQILFYL